MGVLRSLYRFHSGCPLIEGSHGFQRSYLTKSPLGYGRPRRMLATGLRLKEPHRVIVPLSAEEIAKFWRSFRTFSDMALVALMLLNGLRSQETLDLQLEDLQLAEERGIEQPKLTLAEARDMVRIILGQRGSVH
jgi:integrase